jgi:plastocyanin
MRRFLCVLVLSVHGLVAAGCTTRDAPQPRTDYRPTATIKDIMLSIIDPEADVLWNAVATIVSATGTEERAPKTEEEWVAIRQSAIQLVEATNLLRVPGRHVARPGEKSENPRIELEPETMQKLIADDPATWAGMVNGLHDAAVPALNAINARNAQSLFDAGEHIENACERCHQHYWYPPKEAAAWKLEADTVVRDTTVVPAQPTRGGAIRGHVRVKGKLPGNPVIRMGMDPMCAQLNAGKRPVQEIVAATADGSLANVFVSLQGSFPASPVPAEPVTIDQRACVYVPRVVGARVGQTLQVRNSDELLHNVHGVSARSNGFNVSQPRAGIVQQVSLKEEEVMLRVTCDVHRWMTAFVGVVSHPYFATSSVAGTYTIDNVPAGTYTIQAWHEHYGVVTQKVAVAAGSTSTIDFAY